jgi:AcrR family transcriptional regulator
MAPRTYQLGKRQSQVDESRQKVIAAARSLLGDASGYSSFTVNAVAARADVSKVGLLEAVCDALAKDGQMFELPSAFMNPDPVQAIETFITSFGRFWDADRQVMRRLRGLAALDPEVGAVISGRDERRRAGLEVLMTRLDAAGLLTVAKDLAVKILVTLTSFETFDTLAAPNQALTEVAPIVSSMAARVWT